MAVVDAMAPTAKRTMSFLFASSVVLMFVISLSSRFSVCAAFVFCWRSSSRILPFSRFKSSRCDACILSISYLSSARSLSLHSRGHGRHSCEQGQRASGWAHHSARTPSKSRVIAACRTSSVVLISALNRPKAASCTKLAWKQDACQGEALIVTGQRGASTFSTSALDANLASTLSRAPVTTSHMCFVVSSACCGLRPLRCSSLTCRGNSELAVSHALRPGVRPCHAPRSHQLQGVHRRWRGMCCLRGGGGRGEGSA